MWRDSLALFLVSLSALTLQPLGDRPNRHCQLACWLGEVLLPCRLGLLEVVGLCLRQYVVTRCSFRNGATFPRCVFHVQLLGVGALAYLSFLFRDLLGWKLVVLDRAPLRVACRLIVRLVAAARSLPVASIRAEQLVDSLRSGDELGQGALCLLLLGLRLLFRRLLTGLLRRLSRIHILLDLWRLIPLPITDHDPIIDAIV